LLPTGPSSSGESAAGSFTIGWGRVDCIHLVNIQVKIE
jgi:hypothetical protein